MICKFEFELPCEPQIEAWRAAQWVTLIDSVLDWWTHKRVFQFDLVKLGHWICTLMYTVCILKTWLVLETMLLANLNMVLSCFVYCLEGMPHNIGADFYIFFYLSFKVVDRVLYHTILQYCKMLMSEVKNKWRIWLLAPKDLRRWRKYILGFVLLQTKSTWSFQENR